MPSSISSGRTCFLRLIGEREVLDSLLASERGQIVVEILAERPIGEPEKFKVKAFQPLAEHLQLAEKAQLLKLDIAQQPVGFAEMQDIEEQGPVDGDLSAVCACCIDSLPHKGAHYRQR